MIKRTIIPVVLVLALFSNMQAQNDYKESVVGLLVNDIREKIGVQSSYQVESDQYMYGATIHLHDYMSGSKIKKTINNLVINYGDVHFVTPAWEDWKGDQARLVGHTNGGRKYAISFMYNADEQKIYVHIVNNDNVDKL